MERFLPESTHEFPSKRLVQESIKVKDNFYGIEANLEVIGRAGIRNKVARQDS